MSQKSYVPTKDDVRLIEQILRTGLFATYFRSLATKSAKPRIDWVVSRVMLLVYFSGPSEYHVLVAGTGGTFGISAPVIDDDVLQYFAARTNMHHVWAADLDPDKTVLDFIAMATCSEEEFRRIYMKRDPPECAYDSGRFFFWKQMEGLRAMQADIQKEVNALFA